jgi:hypothetical protein
VLHVTFCIFYLALIFILANLEINFLLTLLLRAAFASFFISLNNLLIDKKVKGTQ